MAKGLFHPPFFLPEASFGLRVLSSPAFVCVCVFVCQCVHVPVNHYLVHAITCHMFKLESHNWDQKFKITWLRSLMFWGLIDSDPQGQIELKIKMYLILILSPLIEVRILKSWPKMYLSNVKIPIGFEPDWSWPWVSFLILNLFFLSYFASLFHLCHCVILCIFSKTITSETQHWFSSHPTILGYMCVLTIGMKFHVSSVMFPKMETRRW